MTLWNYPGVPMKTDCQTVLIAACQDKWLTYSRWIHHACACWLPWMTSRSVRWPAGLPDDQQISQMTSRSLRWPAALSDDQQISQMTSRSPLIKHRSRAVPKNCLKHKHLLEGSPEAHCKHNGRPQSKPLIKYRIEQLSAVTTDHFNYLVLWARGYAIYYSCDLGELCQAS